MTTIRTLASGSSGNAALLSCGETHLLIDMGISCRRVCKALAELGPLLLRQVREDCLLLDLASAPGGVDQEAAKDLGRRVQSALGLPGRVAPRTAAAAIRDSIYHILEERGEPI